VKGQKIEGTEVLKWTLETKKPVVLHEGGSRSSKTISVIQWIILYCQGNRGKIITIARKHLAWLRPTVYIDFLKVLTWYGFYQEGCLSKGNMTYQLFGNLVRFVGLDESDQKIHGMEQDVTWINEAVEASKDQFDQMEQRTSEKVLLDYNPNFSHHWIYELDRREDVALFRSTILNNRFVPERQRAKIFSYEPTEENIAKGTADPNKWNIYGLGMRGNVEGLIFPNFNLVDELPESYKWKGFGMDYGFTNDPSTLIECRFAEGGLWFHEHFYQTGLNSSDISKKLSGVVDKRDTIVADTSNPMTNDELRRLYGWRVSDAIKGRIIAGLDQLKGYPIHITKASANLVLEFQNYRYKHDRATDSYLNEPAPRQDDHAIDAARYVATFHLKPRGSIRASGVY
jgi:phage terminase large subunit